MGNRAPVHRTTENCSIPFQGAPTLQCGYYPPMSLSDPLWISSCFQSLMICSLYHLPLPSHCHTFPATASMRNMRAPPAPSVLYPGGISLSDIRNMVPTNPEYLSLWVPSFQHIVRLTSSNGGAYPCSLSRHRCLLPGGGQTAPQLRTSLCAGVTYFCATCHLNLPQ